MLKVLCAALCEKPSPVCSTSQRHSHHQSDTPLIDHLLMREFVSRPPSYRSIHKGVRDKKPTLIMSRVPGPCNSRVSNPEIRDNCKSEPCVSFFSLILVFHTFKGSRVTEGCMSVYSNMYIVVLIGCRLHHNLDI